MRTASQRWRVWGFLFLLLQSESFVVICFLLVVIRSLFAVGGRFCGRNR